MLVGRAEHVDGFKGLSQYMATTHFNGQSTVVLNGDQATAESYCLAHHLLQTDQGRSLIVMSIRYEDSFVKSNGDWFFAQRKLVIDWTDTRPSQPS